MDRLDAVQRKRAGAWLAVFPSNNLGLWIAPAEFVTSCKLWLGLASREERRSLLRPGLAMHSRHDAVRDCLFEAAKTAGVRPQKEVIVDSSGRRPADVLFPAWSRGRPLAIDVTVTNPSQISSTQSARDGLNASERAAVAKVSEKERKYKAQCAAKGVEFIAAAVCCYGGWLSEAEEVVKELGTRVAHRTHVSPGLAVGQLWQRIAVALWRGNARQVLRHTW